jgi:hypothetical protein
MIAHVVLVTPRPDLSTGARDAFASAFEDAVRVIPTVRGVRVGRRVTHGAGYESAAPPFEFFAMIEFDDLGALKEYLTHPAHSRLAERFGTDLSAAAVWDFELGSLQDLLRLRRVP